jgi:hypothetical protein
MPMTVSRNLPSTNIRVPSTSRPSPTKNAVTESRSATVMPTWSKRRAWDMGSILQLLDLSIHSRDVADSGFSTSGTSAMWPVASIARRSAQDPLVNQVQREVDVARHASGESSP